MNKKTIIAFFLGFVTAGTVFGALSVVRHSTRHADTPAPQILEPAISDKTPTSIPKAAAPASQFQIEEIRQPSETAAFKAFLSPNIDGHSLTHEVRSGDTLTSISRKYHVTLDLIRRINRIDEDKLILGSKLKIPTYKLSVVVDKSQNTLILKGDEDVLKTYVVSTGVNNSTPVGVFKITDKLIHPTWYKPGGKAIPYGDPRNLLGTRWMGISKKGYGIHGTLEPEKLGQQVTDGCVRMRNEEVEELYGFLIPGTEVTIVD